MKKIILFITILSIFSCQQKTEKEKLKDEFSKIAFNTLQILNQEETPSEKIDSLKLIRIDTITEMHQIIFVMNFVNQNFKTINDKKKDILDDMRLYSAIDAGDLIKIKKNEFDKLNDSMKYYTEIFDDIKKVKADSIKLLDYNTTFLKKSHNIKTNIAKQDSVYLIFNKSKQIVTDNEYLKEIISKFRNKSKIK